VQKKSKTSLDYTNAITSAHDEAEQAFNVINTNTLLPANFGKYELSYIDGPDGFKLIKSANYYSLGEYEKTKITFHGDELGTAHKTTLNLVNRTPESLAGKSFVLYDDIGAVVVWFNVDFNNTAPSVDGSYRNIPINILSSHTHEIIASKIALALSIDTKFIGVYTLSYVIISSSSTGIKPDSYDINTGLFVKNTAGTNPESLNNKYFFINSENNSSQYCLYFSVNGNGVNPDIQGKINLAVEISAGCTANAVAQATRSILDTTDKFITNIDSDSLYVKNKLIGETTSSTAETSNFFILIENEGKNREHLTTIILNYDTQGNVISVEKI